MYAGLRKVNGWMSPKKFRCFLGAGLCCLHCENMSERLMPRLVLQNRYSDCPKAELVPDDGVFCSTRILSYSFKIRYLQLDYKLRKIPLVFHSIFHRCWTNLGYTIITQICTDLVKQYNSVTCSFASMGLYEISEKCSMHIEICLCVVT